MVNKAENGLAEQIRSENELLKAQIENLIKAGNRFENTFREMALNDWFQDSDFQDTYGILETMRNWNEVKKAMTKKGDQP